MTANSSARTRATATVVQQAVAAGAAPPRRSPVAAGHILGLAVSVTVGACYLAAFVTKGWVPHDEGVLAQSAQRVLSGEWPHRDFDEIYTGGLSLLNAVAFSLLGERLVATRIALYVIFVASIPATYWIASRFAGPAVATLGTLTALAWGLPNYFAAVPSWYNLIFALAGTACLLKHHEDPRKRWLVLAGVAGGLSLLMKISGFFFIAAAACSIAYSSAAGPPRTGGRNSRVTRLGPMALGLAGIIVLLAALVVVAVSWGLREAVYLFLAPALVLAWLGWDLARAPLHRTTAHRLGISVAALAIGVLAPILLYGIPYLLTHSLSPLLHGVFVAPRERLSYATYRPPPLSALAAIVPITCLTVAGGLLARRNLRSAIWFICGVGLLGVTLSGGIPVYRLTWFSVYAVAPLLPIAAFLVAERTARPTPIARLDRHRLFTMAAVVAFVALVQFPFAAPVYFLYAAPLLVLATIAVGALQHQVRGAILAAVLVYYGTFAVARLNPGYIYQLGRNFAADRQLAPLGGAAGGIRVSETDRRLYTDLTALIRRHEPGNYIYAAPDCPEIYFLAGKRNPTRTMFDFFDARNNRAATIIHAIEAHGVHVVVLNTAPDFSPDIEPGLLTELTRRFPASAPIGHFIVRWRE